MLISQRNRKRVVARTATGVRFHYNASTSGEELSGHAALTYGAGVTKASNNILQFAKQGGVRITDVDGINMAIGLNNFEMAITVSFSSWSTLFGRSMVPLLFKGDGLRLAGSPNSFNLMYDALEGMLVFMANTMFGNSSVSNRTLYSTQINLRTSADYAIVVKRVNNELSFYVNGTKYGTFAFSDTISDISTRDLYLGECYDAKSGEYAYLHGTVANAKFTIG